MKLAASVLLVDDRPMFPRVIQHRGEPLATLKKLGFNAVWLRRCRRRNCWRRPTVWGYG